MKYISGIIFNLCSGLPLFFWQRNWHSVSDAADGVSKTMSLSGYWKPTSKQLLATGRVTKSFCEKMPKLFYLKINTEHFPWKIVAHNFGLLLSLKNT
jgi:hypothetical protein